MVCSISAWKILCWLSIVSMLNAELLAKFPHLIISSLSRVKSYLSYMTMELEPPLDLVRILDSSRVPLLSSKLSPTKPMMLIWGPEKHCSLLNSLNLVIDTASGKYLKTLYSFRPRKFTTRLSSTGQSGMTRIFNHEYGKIFKSQS